MKPLLIGHRGASGYADENTIKAFSMALSMGCDGIELDVHADADGNVWVIHDETLERTTTLDGYVARTTADELRKARTLPGNEPLPTLQQVLDQFGNKCLINIEVKAIEAALPAARLVNAFCETTGGSPKYFIFSSFDDNILNSLRNFRPELQLGVLEEGDWRAALHRSLKYRAYSVHLHHTLLNELSVNAICSHELRIFAWTVNSTQELERMNRLGVHAIITDYPQQ